MDRGKSIEAAIVTDVGSTLTEPSPCLGWARAIVDYVPSPYDKQALSLRRGDLIQVTGMREGGTWEGECGGRRGTFKFINVKMVEEDPSEPSDCSLAGLLSAVGLSAIVPRLELNGFDNVLVLKTISREDLEFFEIEDREVQDKILTVATVVRYVTGKTN